MATEVTTPLQQTVPGSVERLRPRDPGAATRGSATVTVSGRQDLPPGQSTASTQGAFDQARLNQVVDDLNSYAQNVRRELHFSVDKESGHTVIKVVDSESQEVVRQIPPEEVTEMSQHLTSHAGVLMRTKV